MKKIFMAVDCQVDFMDKNGKLYVEGAEDIKKNISSIDEYAKNNGINTIFTIDSHYPSSSELSDKPDFKTTFPVHCLAGTDGACIIEELYRDDDRYYKTSTWLDESTGEFAEYYDNDIIVLKDQFDIFGGGDNFEKILEEINPDEVIVYGVVTSVCVNFAVMGLLKRGYNVTVVTDAIKDLPGSEFDMSTWEVKGNKAKLVKTEDIIKEEE